MDKKAELTAVIRFLHQSGWAPATSSNYSFREEGQAGCWVSQSGIDKGGFLPEHFLKVDAQGQNPYDDRKPSAETALHTLVYRIFPEASCVLHTHSVMNTTLSQLYAPEGAVVLEGYELLKAFEGVATHQERVVAPIFANTQDIPALAAEVEAYVAAGGPPMRFFLIAGHGLYTWGGSIAAARRHVEAAEFLLQCVWMKNWVQQPINISHYGHSYHSR
jgi:methylthioribulose-1-phosphate dehydratase